MLMALGHTETGKRPEFIITQIAICMLLVKKTALYLEIIEEFMKGTGRAMVDALVGDGNMSPRRARTIKLSNNSSFLKQKYT